MGQLRWNLPSSNSRDRTFRRLRQNLQLRTDSWTAYQTLFFFSSDPAVSSFKSVFVGETSENVVTQARPAQGYDGKAGKFASDTCGSPVLVQRVCLLNPASCLFWSDTSMAMRDPVVQWFNAAEFFGNRNCELFAESVPIKAERRMRILGKRECAFVANFS